jgi:hypothetical protein
MTERAPNLTARWDAALAKLGRAAVIALLDNVGPDPNSTFLLHVSGLRDPVRTLSANRPAILDPIRLDARLHRHAPAHDSCDDLGSDLSDRCGIAAPTSSYRRYPG